MKNIALIPARSGSKRIVNKNIRPLAGHPLIAYTIAAARQSRVFDEVMVSTDSKRYARIAEKYGAHVPYLRPRRLAGDVSPDIEWVEDILGRINKYDYFSILRPTSPFRLPETIGLAWFAFSGETGVDSLRAVERCSQHPGKMWVVRGGRMLPLLPLGGSERPWHSRQYPALPTVYVQNASLEIARTEIVYETGTIAGRVVMPFYTQGYEGFDLNTEMDWKLADMLVATGAASLPDLNKSA